MKTIVKILIVCNRIVSLMFFVAGIVFWINPGLITIDLIKNTFGVLLMFIGFIPIHDVELARIKAMIGYDENKCDFDDID